MKFYHGILPSMRLSAGYTQAELGKILGVSQQAVQNWEAGRNTPTRGMVPLIAKALGCAVEEISDLPPDPDIQPYKDFEEESWPAVVREMADKWPALPQAKRDAIQSVLHVLLDTEQDKQPPNP